MKIILLRLIVDKYDDNNIAHVFTQNLRCFRICSMRNVDQFENVDKS